MNKNEKIEYDLNEFTLWLKTVKKINRIKLHHLVNLKAEFKKWKKETNEIKVNR